MVKQKKGWKGGKKGHQSAGEKAGEKTGQEHGEAFYQEINRQGGKSQDQPTQNQDDTSQTESILISQTEDNSDQWEEEDLADK